jgi:hypothetical protein
MTAAPIALFVYNRPSHSRQTVEALQKNSLSRDSDLFVFSDAPKSTVQTEAVSEVRQYIRQIDGFKSMHIVERKKNFGLARSIIEGVTRLCEEYGRVIVMEDDLITSPHFLKFMNDALDMYEHEDRVMHISGATYPIKNVKCETFFFRVPLCWGWATWDQSWKSYKKDVGLMASFDKKMCKQFNIDNTYNYWDQLECNKNGTLNTWFVFWYATLFLRGGLACFPARSLVQNIGMDGSGVHSGPSNNYYVKLSQTPINISKALPIEENKSIVEQHKRFFRRVHPQKSLLKIPNLKSLMRVLSQWIKRLKL